MNAVAERTESKAVSTWDDRPAPAVNESAAIIQMIERIACDPTVDIARLEKIMELRERVEARNARMAYSIALSEMQPTLPIIERNGRIVIHNKDDRNKGVQNPRVEQSTPYALWEDINEAIRGPLAANGFALSFRTGQTAEGKITVTAILSHREGHQEETTMILAHDSTGSKNAVQAVGSSIQYGKRYTAGLLLNLTSRAPHEADDDGKAAGAADLIDSEQFGRLSALIEETGANKEIFLKFFKVEQLADLPAASFARAVKMLEAKRKG